MCSLLFRSLFVGKISLTGWVLVASWGVVAAGHAGEVESAEGGRLGIHVSPRVVYEGSLVTLSVRCGGEPLEPPLRPSERMSVSWSVERGRLHADDLLEVDWRAPRRRGPVLIRARLVEGRGGSEIGTRELVQSVDVRPPSVEGMVWIPPGSFVMGDLTNAYDSGQVKTIQNSGDEPPVRVDLDGFWIDRYPVTNERYRAFLQASLDQGIIRVTPVSVLGRFEGSEVPFYYFQSFEKLIPESVKKRVGKRPTFRHEIRYDGPGSERGFRIEAGRERHPVVDVTWFGAAAYAAYFGRSLPTEAQWEKAARGTDGRRFPWGSNVPTAYHAAVFDGERGAEPPVGFFSPEGDSPYGVSDMFSGIFEWTGDWFNPYFYADNSMETPVDDPTGPFWGRAHTIRGLPHVLRYPAASLEPVEPVSSRYSWHFEFFLGDSFANADTGFRTVLGRRE